MKWYQFKIPFEYTRKVGSIHNRPSVLSNILNRFERSPLSFCYMTLCRVNGRCTINLLNRAGATNQTGRLAVNIENGRKKPVAMCFPRHYVKPTRANRNCCNRRTSNGNARDRSFAEESWVRFTKNIPTYVGTSVCRCLFTRNVLDRKL